MGLRCVNDYFGYCVGKPTGPLPDDDKVASIFHGRCSHRPESCKYYRTSSQLALEQKQAKKTAV